MRAAWSERSIAICVGHRRVARPADRRGCARRLRPRAARSWRSARRAWPGRCRIRRPSAVRSSRTSSWPCAHLLPGATRIASTMPPSRLDMTCSCELAMTRPCPRTVRSSSVERGPDDEDRRRSRGSPTAAGSRPRAAGSGRRDPRGAGCPRSSSLSAIVRPPSTRDALEDLVARAVGDDPPALDDDDPARPARATAGGG